MPALLQYPPCTRAKSGRGTASLLRASWFSGWSQSASFWQRWPTGNPRQGLKTLHTPYLSSMNDGPHQVSSIQEMALPKVPDPTALSTTVQSFIICERFVNPAYRYRSVFVSVFAMIFWMNQPLVMPTDVSPHSIVCLKTPDRMLALVLLLSTKSTLRSKVVNCRGLPVFGSSLSGDALWYTKTSLQRYGITLSK